MNFIIFNKNIMDESINKKDSIKSPDTSGNLELIGSRGKAEIAKLFNKGGLLQRRGLLQRNLNVEKEMYKVYSKFPKEEKWRIEEFTKIRSIRDKVRYN